MTEESAREQRPATPQLSAAKRRQILAGARETFRELGYEHASVDAIAARAGVAKAGAVAQKSLGNRRALPRRSAEPEVECRFIRFDSFTLRPSEGTRRGPTGEADN